MNRMRGDCVDGGYAFNFADLLPNLPFSAFNAIKYDSPGCHRPPDGVAYPDYLNMDWVNGVPLNYRQPCDTIVDEGYFPTLVSIRQCLSPNAASGAPTDPCTLYLKVVPTQIRQLDPAWVRY